MKGDGGTEQLSGLTKGDRSPLFSCRKYKEQGAGELSEWYYCGGEKTGFQASQELSGFIGALR